MSISKRIKDRISNEEYVFIHSYLRVKYGKARKCENPLCERKSYTFNWALRRGFEYELKEENFIQLCCKCHREYDKRENPSELTYKYINAIEKSILGISFVDRFYARPKFLSGVHPLING